MNRYFLTFKDKEQEALYQTTCIGKVRIEMLGIMVIGLTFSLFERIIQAIVQKKIVNMMIYIGMLAYVVIQYYVAKRYQKLLRASFIFLNNFLSIFLIIFEEESDSNQAYLRGANQMGSNVLCLLSGEYIDAIFSLFSIQFIRIIMLVLRSKKNEIFVLFTAIILLVFYATKQFHMYHKALRSQFLLSLKEKQWENILNSIIKEIPFLLITFNEEELKFKEILVKNCQKIMNNETNALEFLRNSSKQGKSLEFIIFQEMKKFKINRQQTLNSQIQVSYNKTLLLVEFSIFSGNQPTILIILKDLEQIRNTQNLKKQYEILQQKVINFIIKFSLNLQKIPNKNVFLKIIRRKFILEKLQNQNLLSYFPLKKICLKQLLMKIQPFYPQTRMHLLINQDFEVQTSQLILNLLILHILEKQEAKNLIIFCQDIGSCIEVRLIGLFIVDQLQFTINCFECKHKYILNEIKISRKAHIPIVQICIYSFLELIIYLYKNFQTSQQTIQSKIIKPFTIFLFGLRCTIVVINSMG